MDNPEAKVTWQKWHQSITNAALHATEQPFRASVYISKPNLLGRLLPVWLKRWLPLPPRWFFKPAVEVKVSSWDVAIHDTSAEPKEEGGLTIILSFETDDDKGENYFRK
jgi:hypothetical protein